MPKIDPETFRGKLYLLVIDKIVIGALIAIALLVYDRWKTQEVRRYADAQTREARLYADAQEETQLAFRRAEYVKQLVPIVLDSKQDVLYRAHSLGALVETKSIDANSGVNFAQMLLDSNLLGSGEYGGFAKQTTEDYFISVMLKTMPLGLPALLNEYRHLHDSRPPGPKGVEPSPLDNNIHFWMRLFWGTIVNHKDSELQLLDSDVFLFRNLETLYEIVGPVMSDEADKLTRRKVKGLRIIGSLHLLRTSGKSEPYAVMQLQAAIDPTPQNPRALEVAALIIALLPYDINDIAPASMSDRLLAIVLRRKDLASWGEPLDNERAQVANAAIWYVIQCARRYPKVAEQLEPTILPVVREFYERLKRTPRGSSLGLNYYVSQMSSIEPALIRILIEANSVPNRAPGSETERLLTEIFSLPEEKLEQGRLRDLAQEWKHARDKSGRFHFPGVGRHNK